MWQNLDPEMGKITYFSFVPLKDPFCRHTSLQLWHLPSSENIWFGPKVGFADEIHFVLKPPISILKREGINFVWKCHQSHNTSGPQEVQNGSSGRESNAKSGDMYPSFRSISWRTICSWEKHNMQLQNELVMPGHDGTSRRFQSSLLWVFWPLLIFDLLKVRRTKRSLWTLLPLCPCRRHALWRSPLTVHSLNNVWKNWPFDLLLLTKRSNQKL